MATTTNPFGLLGLKEGCSLEELNHAYRTKAKLVHPANGGSKELFDLVTNCFNQIRASLMETAPPIKKPVMNMSLMMADGKLNIAAFNKTFQ